MQSLEQLRQQAIISQANKDGLNRFGVFRNSAGNDWIDLQKMLQGNNKGKDGFGQKFQAEKR